jgi:hypothetical protein
MTDYILRFPSIDVAQQFGIANGFAAIDDNGEVQSSLASHTHALCVIGEHFVEQPDIDGKPQHPVGDGQYWILFRDLVGIPVPDGGEHFIVWSSASGKERPTDGSVPMTWWA